MPSSGTSIPPDDRSGAKPTLFAARHPDDVQADVNVILDTLLAADRLVSEAHRQHDTQKGIVIDFALDAVKRLRKDALGV